MMDHIQIIAQVHTITHLKKVAMMNAHKIQLYTTLHIPNVVINTQHKIVHIKVNIYLNKI